MTRRKPAAIPWEMTPAELRDHEARHTTEESFRLALRKTAADLGWSLQYHTKFSLGSDKGFPDEVYLRGPRCVVVECKRVGLVPTPRQQAWLDAWALVPGVQAFHWTPLDWDRIYEVLAWEPPKE